MQQVIAFAVLGLGPGAIYALTALGIVQIFRGSDTLNFAQGGIALVSATLVFQLWGQHGWPLVPTFIVALSSGAIIGVVVSYVMRPLRQSSAIVRIIATTGILAALEQGLLLIFGSSLGANTVALVPNFYPSGGLSLGGGIAIGYDRLTLLAIAIVLTVAVATIMHRTKFGLATVAAAESPVAARALGFSPDVISAGNWAIGGALAAAAGALIVPISGLTIDPIVLLVVPAFAAALLGGFRSYYVTLIGALALGVGQSLATRYVGNILSANYSTGWADALPFLVIIVLLTVRGVALTSRGEHAVRQPRIGRGRPSLIRFAALTGAGMLVAGLASGAFAPYITNGVTFAFIALSFVVVVGLSGQLSFAQSALGGVGALIAARVVYSYNLPFIVALLIAIVAAALIGALVALPVMRTRGPSLAVVTLALALGVQDIVFNNQAITGGFNGTPVRPATLFGWNIWEVDHPQAYAIVVVALFGLTCLLVANIAAGPIGRRLAAVRSNERAAAALGMSIRGAKIYAFAVGASIAAVGGVLIGFRSQSVNYSQFGYDQDLAALTASLIGGVGFVLGAVMTIFQQITGPFPGFVFRNISWYGEWFTILSGATLLLTLIQFPNGVAAGLTDLAASWRDKLRRSPTPATPEAEAPEPAIRVVSTDRRQVPPDRILSVENLTVRFGAVTAVDHVSLSVRPGHVTGVIGANGAGKSTLIDAVTGFVPAASGKVTFAGQDITGLSVQRRARLGIQRCFQHVELFDDLTVGENLTVALERISSLRWLSSMVHVGHSALTQRVWEVAEELHISDHLDRQPDELSFGQRRMVGVARALAADPDILLLDEPAAGLDDAESEELGRLIRQVAQDWGIGVLLIEHDVPLVAAVSDFVIALDFGKSIEMGTPTDVLASASVRRAYLGEEDAGQAPATAEYPGGRTAS